LNTLRRQLNVRFFKAISITWLIKMIQLIFIGVLLSLLFLIWIVCLIFYITQFIICLSGYKTIGILHLRFKLVWWISNSTYSVHRLRIKIESGVWINWRQKIELLIWVLLSKVLSGTLITIKYRIIIIWSIACLLIVTLIMKLGCSYDYLV
jgi:hypothetical protein